MSSNTFAGGGAAAVITDANFDLPSVTDVVMKKGNTITCSYKEEHSALTLGLEWLQSKPPYNCVLFCTDSLSLLMAIDNDSQDTFNIRRKIQGFLHSSFDLFYVPGHKDIPGNELADGKAKEAAKLPGPGDEAVSFSAAKSVIRKEVKDPPPEHRHTKRLFNLVSIKKDEEQLKTRKETTTITQLRSGHFKGLAYYDSLVD